MARYIDEQFSGQHVVRTALAYALAKGSCEPPAAVAKRFWPNDRIVEATLVTRANEVAGAGRDSWGSELVAADRSNAAFLDLLRSATVFDGLPLVEVPLNVRISAGSEVSGGGWVAEGHAIEVVAGSFAEVLLPPLKLGAIAVRSLELVVGGGIAGETLMRDALVQATRIATDKTFFDSTAASDNVRPAGMLNGVTPTAASGTHAEAVRVDIAVMVAAFAAANLAGGPLVLVASPALAGIIGLMSDAAGGRAFPGASAAGGVLCDFPLRVTDQLADDVLVMLAPSAIVKAGGDTDISSSTNATISMSSAAAADTGTPTGETQGMVSMYQTESIALKCARRLNWQKRSASAVQAINSIAYVIPAA